MNLNLEQIQFIDTYLKNSEIEFIDVRMEMVDHVASEVEAKMEAENLDFYNAFKNYMVVHKKEHKKANKKFIKTTDIKVLKEICIFLIKPISFLILIGCFTILKLLVAYFDIYQILRFSPLIILLALGIFYFLTARIKKKERYSGLERIGFILILITQMVQIFFYPSFQINHFEDHLNLNILLISFLVVLSIGFVQLVLKYRKEYVTLYKNNFA